MTLIITALREYNVLACFGFCFMPRRVFFVYDAKLMPLARCTVALQNILINANVCCCEFLILSIVLYSSTLQLRNPNWLIDATSITAYRRQLQYRLFLETPMHVTPANGAIQPLWRCTIDHSSDSHAVRKRSKYNTLDSTDRDVYWCLIGCTSPLYTNNVSHVGQLKSQNKPLTITLCCE